MHSHKLFDGIDFGESDQENEVIQAKQSKHDNTFNFASVFWGHFTVG